MLMKLAADLVALVHFLFIAFVVVGGVLVWRRPWLAWLHLPAVAWGVLVMSMGWLCPLTPLENWLLRQAGLAGYEGGFMEHYLLPIIYPENITRGAQVALGLTALGINLAAYAAMLYRRRGSRPDKRA